MKRINLLFCCPLSSLSQAMKSCLIPCYIPLCELLPFI